MGKKVKVILNYSLIIFTLAMITLRHGVQQLKLQPGESFQINYLNFLLDGGLSPHIIPHLIQKG